MPRGPVPREAYSSEPSSAGSSTSATAVRWLDQLCAIMPPRMKLDYANAIEQWAHQKRRDAMDQLGLRDEPPPAPTPPGRNGQNPIDTSGEAGW
jgi:hypothetical protein